jgi:hypothetical protein
MDAKVQRVDARIRRKDREKRPTPAVAGVGG